LLPLIVLCLAACAREHAVTEVVDGDTFRLAGGETVRIIGINTPEISEPGGDIAKDIANRLLLGKRVRLQRDVRDRDAYDRLLRYVHVGDLFVNAELVRLGYAEARFYPPDTARMREILAAEREAVRNRRGFWSFNVFQAPDTAGIADRDKPPDPVPRAAVSWREADKHYGQNRTVEGKIVATNNTGKVCFLNFDRNWRESFTAVIFAGDFDRFPRHPEEHYLGRTVRVTGLIKEYKGKPEIVLKSPEQIEIIK
jgi:micrococcal nuclease